MTPDRRKLLSILPTSAATLAALLLCFGPAVAQDVTITSRGGALSLTGRVMSFDGVYLQIESPYGPLSLEYEGVSCVGDTCPDTDNFVPRVRLSGSARMADVLMPALIAGFARSRAFGVNQIDIDPAHFDLILTDGASGPVAEFAFRATTAAEGFADLTTFEADIVMAMREPNAQERQIAQEVGIGTLDATGQSRIVGLDALVPVVSPGRDDFVLTIADLMAAFTNDADDVTLHLGPLGDGATTALLAGVERVADLAMKEQIVRHDSPDAIATAVALDPNAIGLLPQTQTGVAQPVSLQDSCGLVATARPIDIKTQDYPLTTPLFLYMPQHRQPQIVRDFLTYLRTPAAQLIVRRAGFVDPAAVPIPLDAQGQRLGNAIAAAGQDVPLTELQRLVRLMLPRTRLSLSYRFEAGSTRLDPTSRANLLTLAHDLHDGGFDGRSLLLIGFSDGVGPAEANRKLSGDRAETVVQALREVMGGMPADEKIDTAAFGETLPIGCDTTSWGRQMNRRVELWVAD